MGFVPRLIALTVAWLLATTALTYAAAHRMGTAHPAPATTTAAAPAAKPVLVVPDVRRQAYVFAKGTLGDAGFAWKVAGAVRGFAANTVVSQTPAPGTRVVDTGSPLIVLRLTHPSGAKETGLPEDVSAVHGTRVKLADLAVAAAPPAAVVPARVPESAPSAPASAPSAPASAPAKQAPAPRSPQNRPPAFVVAGARKEPLDEMPLTQRADQLLLWIQGHPKATDANVRHWLFQHAWIVAGAQMGWWHGADALRTLVTVDNRVWAVWGIGARSEAVARRALAEVEARTS